MLTFPSSAEVSVMVPWLHVERVSPPIGSPADGGPVG
jgi:hypothetical protein